MTAMDSLLRADRDSHKTVQFQKDYSRTAGWRDALNPIPTPFEMSEPLLLSWMKNGNLAS